jgi:hypothetical protein
VILCSGYVQDVDEKVMEALQIVERFDKPVSGGELLMAIRRILDRG